MIPLNSKYTISMQRARAIVLRALAGEYDLLIACRELSELSGQLPGVKEDVMDVFSGVASEIDGHPVGEERKHWADAALAEEDIKTNAYRLLMRHVITEALQELLVALPEV